VGVSVEKQDSRWLENVAPPPPLDDCLRLTVFPAALCTVLMTAATPDGPHPSPLQCRQRRKRARGSLPSKCKIACLSAAAVRPKVRMFMQNPSKPTALACSCVRLFCRKLVGESATRSSQNLGLGTAVTDIHVTCDM